MGHPRILPAVLASAALALTGAAAALASPPPPPSDVLVSVASPPTPFSQNKQNEPAVAIDAHDPNVVVAGSNDEIDEESCAAGDPTTCPFTAGRGRVRRLLLVQRRRLVDPADVHGLTRA